MGKLLALFVSITLNPPLKCRSLLCAPEFIDGFCKLGFVVECGNPNCSVGDGEDAKFLGTSGEEGGSLDLPQAEGTD